MPNLEGVATNDELFENCNNGKPENRDRRASNNNTNWNRRGLRRHHSLDEQRTRKRQQHHRTMPIFQSLLGTLVSSLRPRGDDDFVDRLNYFYTPILLMSAAILTSLNQYINQPLQCWLPEGWTHNMEQYIESYCWVQNTYFLPIHEHIPDDYVSREQRQIPYYQWVPFILVMQAMMFTFPCVMWRLLNWQTGVSLTQLIHCSMEINSVDVQVRQKMIRTAGRAVQDTLDMQAALSMVIEPQKHARLATDEESPTAQFADALAQQQTKFVQRCNGRYLTVLYLMIKLFYVLNIVTQLIMLNLLLQGAIYPFYGYIVLRDLLRGHEWFVSGHFPRVTLCDFEVRTLGNINRYTVQCTLPINLFNEKVFVFFWVWLTLLAVITAMSFLFWMTQQMWPYSRRDFVLRYLYVAAANAATRAPTVSERALFLAPASTYNRFIDDYLRTDGTFILRVLSNHVGDVITLEVLKHLWREFRMRNRNEFMNFRSLDESLLVKSVCEKVGSHDVGVRHRAAQIDVPSSGCPSAIPKRQTVVFNWPTQQQPPVQDRVLDLTQPPEETPTHDV